MLCDHLDHFCHVQKFFVRLIIFCVFNIWLILSVITNKYSVLFLLYSCQIFCLLICDIVAININMFSKQEQFDSDVLVFEFTQLLVNHDSYSLIHFIAPANWKHDKTHLVLSQWLWIDIYRLCSDFSYIGWLDSCLKNQLKIRKVRTVNS